MIAVLNGQSKELNNFLVGTKYFSTSTVFANPKSSKYLLSNDLNSWGGFGNFIEFEEKSFISYSYPECRHDCFITIKGDYYFLREYAIKVNATSFESSYYCDESSKQKFLGTGYFYLKKAATGWNLVRCKKA